MRRWFTGVVAVSRALIAAATLLRLRQLARRVVP
jgi:hypothetical protein